MLYGLFFNVQGMDPQFGENDAKYYEFLFFQTEDWRHVERIVLTNRVTYTQLSVWLRHLDRFPRLREIVLDNFLITDKWTDLLIEGLVRAKAKSLTLTITTRALVTTTNMVRLLAEYDWTRIDFSMPVIYRYIPSDSWDNVTESMLSSERLVHLALVNINSQDAFNTVARNMDIGSRAVLRIERLVLRHVTLEPQALHDILPKMSALTHLSLSDCDLRSERAATLFRYKTRDVEAPEHEFPLLHLHLRKCMIDQRGLRFIAGFIRKTHVVDVDLSDNNLWVYGDNSGMQTLRYMVSVTKTLARLALNNTNLSPHDMVYVSNMVQHSSALRVLELRGALQTDQSMMTGLCNLCAALRGNTTLRELYLDDNKIGPTEMRAFDIVFAQDPEKIDVPLYQPEQRLARTPNISLERLGLSGNSPNGRSLIHFIMLLSYARAPLTLELNRVKTTNDTWLSVIALASGSIGDDGPQITRASLHSHVKNLLDTMRTGNVRLRVGAIVTDSIENEDVRLKLLMRNRALTRRTEQGLVVRTDRRRMTIVNEMIALYELSDIVKEMPEKTRTKLEAVLETDRIAIVNRLLASPELSAALVEDMRTLAYSLDMPDRERRELLEHVQTRKMDALPELAGLQSVWERTASDTKDIVRNMQIPDRVKYKLLKYIDLHAHPVSSLAKLREEQRRDLMIRFLNRTAQQQ